jgi:hypothetical protein
MRIAAAVALLLAFVCDPAPGQDCGAHRRAIVTDSGVGALSIGLAVTQVKERCRVVRDTVRANYDFAEAQRALSVLIGVDTVLAWAPNDTVSGIDIASRSLRTRDSLGVGTRLRTLLRRPGVTGATGETSTHAALAAHCGLAFVLSGGGREEDGAEYSAREMRTWPDTITVTRIEIFGCRWRTR